MNREEFDALLEAMIASAEGISDLLFISGRPMQVEIQGDLKPFLRNPSDPPLTSARIESMAAVILNANPRLRQEIKEHGSCDCGYRLKSHSRFRVSIFFQNGNYAMVMRHLKPQIPSFEALRLPSILHDFVKEKTGLIFVTGGTGMGKTTTIAALLNEIDKVREVHVITLEDPIEFEIPSRRSTFTQRELGLDFFNFHDGMRAAMRQAPKVIFVGEIRDRETMEIVLNAGETGHLVFSTLHTPSVAGTINRVLGFFAKEEEHTVRARLAGSMRYIIGQRLVPAIAGGRLLVTELMGSNLRTREAIVEGEAEGRRLDDIIEAGNVVGWHTFEQSLLKAYEQDLITDETALLNCSNRMRMIQRLDSLVNKPRKTGNNALVSSLKMQESGNASTHPHRHQFHI